MNALYQTFDNICASLKLPELLKKLQSALEDDLRAFQCQHEAMTTLVSGLQKQSKALQEETTSLKAENTSLKKDKEALKEKTTSLESRLQEKKCFFNKFRENVKKQNSKWKATTAQLKLQLDQQFCKDCRASMSQSLTKRLKFDSEIEVCSYEFDSEIEKAISQDGDQLQDDRHCKLEVMPPTRDIDDDWLDDINTSDSKSKPSRSLLTKFKANASNGLDCTSGTVSPDVHLKEEPLAASTQVISTFIKPTSTVNGKIDKRMPPSPSLIMEDDEDKVDPDETMFFADNDFATPLLCDSTSILPLHDLPDDFSGNSLALSQSILPSLASNRNPKSNGEHLFNGSSCVDMTDLSDRNKIEASENDKAGTTNQRTPVRPIKYVEVVRKKADREKLPGFDCVDCRKFYESENLTDAELKDKLKLCSRHKANSSPPPSTPKEFWAVRFPETQDYMDKGYLLDEATSIPAHARPKWQRTKRK